MMFCKRCNSCKGSSLVEGKAERRFITAISQFGVKHQGCWSKSIYDRNSVTLQLYWEIVRIKAGTHPKNWSSGSDIQWHSTSKSNSWVPLILTHINTEHFPNSSHRLEQEDVQRSPEALRRRGSTRLWVVHPMGCSTATLTSSPAPCQWRPPCLWVLPTSGSAHGRSPQRNPAAWAKWGDLYGYHQE